MIVYLDTSAIVPLLVAEPSTAVCRRLWEDADRVVSSRLAYAEVAAALAMAQRQGRIAIREEDSAWTNFVDMWPQIDVVEVTEAIVTSAATLARDCSLRGDDAVHCASAVAVADEQLLAVAGDRQLLSAWGDVGIATVDTT